MSTCDFFSKIDQVGGIKHFCDKTGLPEKKFRMWRYRNQVPVQEVINIEKRSKGAGFDFDRHLIRPDIYPIDGGYSQGSEE